MITKAVIDALYKKFSKRPASIYDLNIPLLFESIDPSHAIEIDGDELIINSIAPSNPFHSVNLNNVNAIIEFEETVAIVMHSSIIFLSRNNNDVSLHFKPIRTSFIDKMRDKVSDAIQSALRNKSQCALY
ncbi:MAG: hypothetical protein K2M04_04600 [Muribaculaceae bacterium]|nr:hypothetical protein [Muribaculaceae bacterium]